MPTRLTYPGVYVEERSSGVRTITGVSTSTALFVGMAPLGPIGVPTPVRSFDQFVGTFGDDTNYGELTAQVRQFFLNGGIDAVITRAAAGADESTVELLSERGDANVLRLTARDAGVLGDTIRARVDYDTPQPELTFNIEVFRRTINGAGVAVESDSEFFGAVSADPNHPRFVTTILTAESDLVTADALDAPSTLIGGFSQSALVVAGDDDALHTAIDALLGGGINISISVDGGNPVFAGLPAGLADFTAFQTAADIAINNQLAAAGQTGRVAVSAQPFGGANNALRITSTTGASVVISPGPNNDATAGLQLGGAAGGIEIGPYSSVRPAESGFATKLHTLTSETFAANSNLTKLITLSTATRIVDWTLTGTMPTLPPAPTLIDLTVPAGTTFLEGDVVAGLSLRNLSQHLASIAASLTTTLGTEWTVSQNGYRLNLRPNFGDSNAGADAELHSSAFDLGAGGETAVPITAQNTAAYSLGGSGAPLRQAPGLAGTDGAAPTLTEYEAAFSEVERSLDVNLVILPRGVGQSDADRAVLWGPASSACLRNRWFLIVDPPSDAGAWANVDQAAAGIANVRLGAVTDHAAIYWPRLGVGFRPTPIDPGGTMAGIMARTDVRRGVWKAPAGLEAKTLGATGFEHLITDPENGVTNPQAINTLRQFSAGGVAWGTRTMAGFDNSGESDYAQLQVRRTALFIEESLYRGLQFAVFEPNDYRLWGQIRLAAGAFMQNLFRQGAFQGAKASDAYQVICDETTTTQNDINLGRVNVIVMFAPLKAAEFVLLVLQQLAGQIET